jgi:hypothetical protein
MQDGLSRVTPAALVAPLRVREVASRLIRWKSGFVVLEGLARSKLYSWDGELLSK